MSQMKLDLPEDLNFLLKRYALEQKFKTKQNFSREKATVVILNGFLFEYFKEEKNESKRN